MKSTEVTEGLKRVLGVTRNEDILTEVEKALNDEGPEPVVIGISIYDYRLQEDGSVSAKTAPSVFVPEPRLPWKNRMVASALRRMADQFDLLAERDDRMILERMLREEIERELKSGNTKEG